MNYFSNRTLVYFSAALFFIAVGCFAYTQEIYFLIAPVLLLCAIFLLQHPEYLFYLLLLSIPWSVEFNFTPTLGTDLPDEPFMLLAALGLLFYCFYQRKKIKWNKLHPLLLLIALQFLWIIVTTITSTGVVLSAKYLLAKSWYLLAFLMLPLFLFKDEKILKRSCILLLLSMMVSMCAVLIRQAQYMWSFEKVNDAVQPFFRNHVNYSALLVFMVPLQIALLKLSSSKKIKIAVTTALTLTVVALYFSYARGAWLALIVGLCAYWLIQKRILALSFLVFFSAVIAIVFWLKTNDRFLQLSDDYKTTIFHTSFKEHLIATYELKDLSNAERIYRWIAGIRMIEDSWKTGFGPSTFYHQYKAYTLPAFKTYVSNNAEQSTVHNYFLLLLIEQGVIGCFLFIALIVALLWYAQKIYFRSHDKFWKTIVAATASLLLMQCTINFLSDMIETDKAGSVFYLCVAAMIVADMKTRNCKLDFSANV